MKIKTHKKSKTALDKYEQAIINALYSLEELRSGLSIKRNTTILELGSVYHWIFAFWMARNIGRLFGIQFGYMEELKLRFGTVGYLIQLLRVHKVKQSDIKKISYKSITLKFYKRSQKESHQTKQAA